MVLGCQCDTSRPQRQFHATVVGTSMVELRYSDKLHAGCDGRVHHLKKTGSDGRCLPGSIRIRGWVGGWVDGWMWPRCHVQKVGSGQESLREFQQPLQWVPRTPQ